MSCTFILMRHSHAVAESSGPDFQRQLTEAGVELAGQTGRLLRDLDIVPDLVVASEAVRTVETAQTIVEQFESAVPVSSTRDLYQASPSAYLPAIQAATASGVETIMVIGHNPAVGTLMTLLAGQRLSVPPATLGVYAVDAANWFELDSLNPKQFTPTHLIVNARLCDDN